MRRLTALEARVLGVLVEKASTVPDSYPLSLNALVAGCNQKNAREPAMNASEAEVQDAVDALKALSLVVESSGSRVARYEHNARRALDLPSQSVALLATLVLRGAQTSAELRANSERLHRFADVSSVDGFLDELAARPEEKGGPLVTRLARAAGAREARWMQLLGEATSASAPAAAGRNVEPPVSSSPANAPAASSTGLRFDLPAEKTLTFEMTIPIRWGDMDAMGHVNNTVYFRYLEVVRIEWLHRVAGPPDPAGEGPVIVNAFCNFLRQLRYPGDVLARHYVANPGRSSFDTFITLERTDEPGVLVATGGARTVWVDYRRERSVPLPEAVRRLIV